MRAVLQVVSQASVSVGGEVVGAVTGPALLVLVGVSHGDGRAQVDRMARKVHELRVLPDERSAQDLAAPLLVVSQFTLYADTRRGRRPSWSAAAPGDIAQPVVDDLVAALRARGATVETGVFGAEMSVSLVNEGPVTILLET